MLKKKIISIFLVMMMVLTLAPQAAAVSVFAGDDATGIGLDTDAGENAADRIAPDENAGKTGANENAARTGPDDAFKIEPEEENIIVEEEAEGNGMENEVPEDTAKRNAEEPEGTDGVLAEGETIQTHSPDQHSALGFNAWTSTNSLPNTPGSYYLTENVKLTSTWTVPGPAEGATEPAVTNLCLNGHSITAESGDDIISISSSNTTLNLYDCGTTTHYYTLGNNGCAVVNDAQTSVANVKTFTGGYIYGAGRNVIGVFLRGDNVENAVFNMYGGTIIGNGNSGVRVNNGKFNMSGGNILGNTSVYGGGVYVNENASFNMSGGKILGNTSGYGGGVFVYCNASFNMTGGKISYNQAIKNIQNIQAPGCGGGIMIAGNSAEAGSFTMEDGEISHNTAMNSGAIICNNYTKIFLRGGKIINNTANSYAGGIRIDYTNNVYVSGSPVIAGNYLESDGKKTPFNVVLEGHTNGWGKIIIDHALKEGCKIGVSALPSDGATFDGVITRGYSTSGNTEEPYKYFRSDDDQYFIGQDSNGQAILTRSHTHNNTTFEKPWGSKNGENTSLPDTAGSYYLTADISLPSTWTVPGPGTSTSPAVTNLCLNGHSIAVNNTQWGDTKKPVIVINSSYTTLNLYDCGTATHYYTLGSGGRAVVNDSLSPGADVKTFTGGYIYGDGKTERGVSIKSYNDSNPQNAYFNLYGGTIIGNGKGGVYVTNDTNTFNMSGGNIIGNVNSDYGGGVHVAGGASFTMSGGKISYNQAGAGGGVKLQGASNGSSFTMTGGEISNNTADRYGAISFNYKDTITLSGGKIINNTATSGAGCLGIGPNDTVKLSGTPVITGNKLTDNPASNVVLQYDNIYFTDKYAWGKIQFDGTLREGCSVGVSAAPGKKAGESVSPSYPFTFTEGYTSNNTENPSQFFTSDNPDYSVDLNPAGEAFLGEKTEYTITNTTSASANGTISVRDKALAGAGVTITATPDSGYELGCISVKDASGNAVALSGSGNTRTFTMPASNVTVTASFALIKHDITISPSANGTVTVKDNLEKAARGTEITITATPDSGYELGSISVKDASGSAVALTGSGNIRTFTMPASNVTVTASFSFIEIPIDPKVSVAGWTYGSYDAAKNAPVVTDNPGGGAVSFTYYTDAGCKTKTTAANSGAASDGGVPVRAGSYWVKADVAAIYEYTSGTATAGFSVSRAPLTITADSDTKVYDGKPLTKDTATPEGLAQGDKVEKVTVTGTQTDFGKSDNIPTEAVIKNAKDADVTDCYAITYVNGTLEVTQAELTVTADEKTKVYGEEDPVLTYQSAGLVEGDELTGSPARAEGENAGTYEILQGTLAASDNYILTYVPASLTITPKKIIVKADAKTKIEDQKDPKFTYTVEGLVGTDKLKGKLTREPGELPGKYAILQGTLAASENYDLTYKGAKLTIEPIPIRPAKPDYTTFAKMTASGTSTLKLAWAAVKDAAGYDVFFGEAGKTCEYAGKVNASDARTFKFTGLKANKVYKAYVKAWTKVKGVKTYIGKASPTVSTITGGYTKKYCNAKSIAVKKTELTVTKGKNGRIKATVQGVRSDRTVYKPSNLVRYYSSNRKVATVDRDGTVHGKAAGTCKIYAVTDNGIRTSVKITVVR